MVEGHTTLKTYELVARLGRNIPTRSITSSGSPGILLAARNDQRPIHRSRPGITAHLTHKWAPLYENRHSMRTDTRKRKYTMELSLDDERAEELHRVLTQVLGDLDWEIAATDNPGLRRSSTRTAPPALTPIGVKLESASPEDERVQQWLRTSGPNSRGPRTSNEVMTHQQPRARPRPRETGPSGSRPRR